MAAENCPCANKAHDLVTPAKITEVSDCANKSDKAMTASQSSLNTASIKAGSDARGNIIFKDSMRRAISAAAAIFPD